MYAAHCSLSTRRSYGICDDMKQYSTGERTLHGPTSRRGTAGRPNDQTLTVESCRSHSLSFNNDGLIAGIDRNINLVIDSTLHA